MSQFGDGTFKQCLLEYIKVESEVHKMNMFTTIAETAEVIAFLSRDLNESIQAITFWDEPNVN